MLLTLFGSRSFCSTGITFITFPCSSSTGSSVTSEFFAKFSPRPRPSSGVSSRCAPSRPKLSNVTPSDDVSFNVFSSERSPDTPSNVFVSGSSTALILCSAILLSASSFLFLSSSGFQGRNFWVVCVCAVLPEYFSCISCSFFIFSAFAAFSFST